MHGERVTKVLQAVNPHIEVVHKAKDLADAIDYAIKNGIKLINYSAYDHIQADIKRFTPLLDKLPSDIIFVASSGNWGGDVTFPASHPNVIAVANYDIIRRELNKASNIGPEIEISAPGRWVINENGGEVNGTSFSGPAIAGCISIIQSVHLKLTGRHITRNECREVLKRNSEDVLKKGWDEESGHGLFVFKNNWENETRGEGMKLLNSVNYLVVHHSASGDVSAGTIRQWHLNRGFSDIGYHFVIRQDGRMEKGRDLKYQGAHSVPVNGQSIGICCTGDFTREVMPRAQRQALVGLLWDLKQRYPNTRIAQHKDFDATACPGNIPIEEIKREVESMIFKDVKDDGSEAARAIKWCKEQGIYKGDENGNFNPKAPLTREQDAIIRYRQAHK